MGSVLSAFQQKVKHHLEVIYDGILPQDELDNLVPLLMSKIGISSEEDCHYPTPHKNRWDESDIIMITYGDSVIKQDNNNEFAQIEKPLFTLKNFIDEYLSSVVSHVHILPFFPYSSDDGFSVIDYSSVNQSLGDWEDIESIAKDYGLMTDLVINHCSARSQWFQNFIAQEGAGHDFFFTASPDDDTSLVVRPRTSDLLKEVETAAGIKHVWCTFSHDQVDFDFRNPKVLVAFVDIIRLYLEKGTKVFRLDAIAFLWKIVGSTSINLYQTHEVVRLIRTLVEHVAPNTIIITETNIPNRENLTYLGNANEAHAIYNFSLPPLLLHTLVSGDCTYLKSWMMSMPPAQNGTSYFNFIASHDGIGLRPAEGLLDTAELNTLAACMQSFGGKVSWRMAEGGKQKPYELNIALIDALKGTLDGEDEFQLSRFICAHAIMLGLEGIPGIYIHSLIATPNDEEKVINTGQNRGINRHRWDINELTKLLANAESMHAKVLSKLSMLIRIRKSQPAFHPNATQFTLQLGKQIFGYWRQSSDRQQSIFCISNISNETLSVRLSDINLIENNMWYDLIEEKTIQHDQEELFFSPYQTMWISNKSTG
ncbi:sugar phosphorylase [Glaciecola sp. MH2013]|uniref:sugar phosphorylase n=1 Tax=Glaciecola sp. MH2013 TaxID=2785524 RepID=UPI00189E4908|nr:sugar phosphorylase [Glaciecola sp. MH2013]MBF7072894.1 sugar phosphorylase [Glaciecola sp. MH2013]